LAAAEGDGSPRPDQTAFEREPINWREALKGEGLHLVSADRSMETDDVAASIPDALAVALSVNGCWRARREIVAPSAKERQSGA
jgi:hypothetical protein